jgi:hypothetical protein
MMARRAAEAVPSCSVSAAALFSLVRLVRIHFILAATCLSDAAYRYVTLRAVVSDLSPLFVEAVAFVLRYWSRGNFDAFLLHLDLDAALVSDEFRPAGAMAVGWRTDLAGKLALLCAGRRGEPFLRFTAGAVFVGLV